MNQKQLLNDVMRLKQGEHLNPEQSQAVHEAFRRYVYEGISLGEAFCFKQTRIRSDFLKWERDSYLRLCRYHIPYNSPTDLVKKLEAEIIHFESLLWPRWKHLNQPPKEITALRWHLLQAFKAGLPMPKFKQLYRIIWTDK